MTITQASVFVVSGGARGVTAQCVIELAARFRCRFLLLGRTPAGAAAPTWAVGARDRTTLRRHFLQHLSTDGVRPSPAQIERQIDAELARREVHETLRSVADAGGYAEYVTVDVGDLPTLRRELHDAEARLGPATGLIHGAGVLRDRLIEQKTAADLDAVYGVKVRGLEHLLECLPAGSLQHVALFSSAAGFYGNVGQTDYALANEVLNKTAHLLARQHPRCRVLAVNWGPWDGGMVGPELKRLFETRGIPLIEPVAGARVLADALSTPHQAGVQILVGAPVAPPAFDLPESPIRVRLLRRLHLAANPFLRDHVIGGHAVLPFACALSWLARSCEQVLPGYRFSVAEDFHLLKGIVFDEQLPPEFVLDLEEQRRDACMIRLDARLWSRTVAGQPRYHYAGSFELRADLPVAQVVDLTHSQGAGENAGATLYADGTLFHGPAFQGIEHINRHGSNSLTLSCRLPAVLPSDQGQFPVQTVNAFALDLQLQGVVVWARWALQAASLPTAIERFEHVASPVIGDRFFVTVEITAATESRVQANIVTCAADGRVLSRLTEAALTVSPSLNAQFAPRAAGPVA